MRADKEQLLVFEHLFVCVHVSVCEAFGEASNSQSFFSIYVFLSMSKICYRQMGVGCVKNCS